MTDQQRETPGAGQGTGGEGQDWAVRQNIINGDSVAPDGVEGDQKALSPDPDAIRAALRYLHPEGPWMVNAKTEKSMAGQIGTDIDAAVKWATQRNGPGGLNAYMAPARLRSCLGSGRNCLAA